MRVWVQPPRVQVLAYLTSIKPGATLSVGVTDGAGAKLAFHGVTLLGGWRNEGAAVYQSKLTDAEGKVTLQIPDKLSLDHLTVTTNADEFIPYVGRISVTAS